MLLPTGVVSISSVAALQRNFNAGGVTVATVFILASLYVAARWVLFAGIRRHRDRVIVTGMFWSRSIPLRQVDRVTGAYSSIHWHTRSGIRLITPLSALWSKPRPLQDVTQYNNKQLSMLRGWVREAKKAGAPQWMDRV
ncbi:hypothetical protein [Leifsonia shinshuensis]|uniref:PH domain-containing protein n=1 Tax=Leifsonia shinshuensis TaxID=150026 RepID=A0A7G6YFE0_9MICO|nr:hypothetical protein [Leifsonia shinshuensis]QNE37205.1 hypothetical protein F1C12_20195 [Leifsonia shinshuensis]